MKTEEKSMLVLEYAPSYGIEILRARRFTEEEKTGYLPWFAEIGFTGVGECEKSSQTSHGKTSPAAKRTAVSAVATITHGSFPRKKPLYSTN